MQFIVEGEIAPKHKDMPKFVEYLSTEQEIEDRVQIDNERDVFETKLNSQEKVLYDRIINDNQFKIKDENPLLRDTYRTPIKMNEQEKQLFDYILADRSLRSDEIFEANELSEHLDNKGKFKIYFYNDFCIAIGMTALSNQKDEAKTKLKKQISDTNFINNTLLNKIMIKREQLKSKLSNLEEMNKVYNQKTHDDKQRETSISSVQGFDFLSLFEKNKKLEQKAISIRYSGKNTKLQRMDEILLSLETGTIDLKLQSEFVKLCQEFQRDFSENMSFHSMKINYGLITGDANYSINSFEE